MSESDASTSSIDSVDSVNALDVELEESPIPAPTAPPPSDADCAAVHERIAARKQRAAERAAADERDRVENERDKEVLRQCLAQAHARIAELEADQPDRPLYESTSRVNLPKGWKGRLILVGVVLMLVGGGMFGGSQINVSQEATQSTVVTVTVVETLLAEGDFEIMTPASQATVYRAAPESARGELWEQMHPEAQAKAGGR